jgi:endo-1,4-beta-mannosidase
MLGINYWPRRSAMYMWQRFDLGEIREDAARIRELGLDMVRFFLLWDAFQPSAATMDRTVLKHLEEIVEAFGNAGLRVMPTLFCGHMSGVNWLPDWTLDSQTPHGRFRTISGERESLYGIGDFYTDEKLLNAQLLFARTVGSALRDHPALYAWDLGNEFSNLREPETPKDAAAWSLRLTDALRESSNIGATGGIHGEDLERDRNIRPSSISQPWEFASMHGYSVYSGFSRGRLDQLVVPYLERLVSSFTEKPVFFTEFGNPTCPPGTVSPYDRVPLPGEKPEVNAQHSNLKNAAPFACLDEDEMAGYASGVLDRLQRGGAIGAMWWCWADYIPQLAALPPFDKAPHELTFGIIRNNGTEKPIARVLQQFTAQKRDIVTFDTPNGLAEPIAEESNFYAHLPGSISAIYRSYCEENQ